MQIVESIPCLSDNYSWAVRHSAAPQSQCVVVDPGESGPVLEYVSARNLSVSALLITHGHHDHIGGVNEITQKFHCPVFGPEGVPGVTDVVREGDDLFLLEGAVEFTTWETPGHCPEHVSFVSKEVLFCGDTLFSCGCGRVFGSSPEVLYTSLQRFTELPPEIGVYCGHEYTLSNLAFALKVFPKDEELISFGASLRKEGEPVKPTLPSTIGREQMVNPFLRVNEPEIQEGIRKVWSGEGLEDDVDYFVALRGLKDRGL